MTTTFDVSSMIEGNPDASARSAPSPQSQTRHDPAASLSPPPLPLPSSSSSSSRPSSNVTIYQTTGPDAHTGPLMAPGGSGTPLLNPRSCVTCRRRKVRCDKQMPCSNCRRALIPCVFPAPGRAPRQHRPRDPNVPPKTTSQREVELVKRLKKLEGIVEELSGQIELDAGGRLPSVSHSPDVAHPAIRGSPSAHRRVSGSLDALATGSSSPKDDDSNIDASESARQREARKQFGRMVLDDTKGTSRYVSSGFWSKLNDELDAIREETQKLTDEDDFSDYDATPSDSPATAVSSVYDHHAFILGYRSADVNLHKCHPLPSHSTFMWSVYQQSIDPLIKILHGPTTEAILSEARKSPERLSPNHEALVFAIYFGAITALEHDEVQTNFGINKYDLLSQYRFALEQSLAKANFLNTSDLSLLQAFTIFLLVVRSHDESRFCWSLTGLLIRIAQGMGVHRDGTHFGLPALETEMRRRVWWAILTLDLRSAEELGSDMMVGETGYDTELPTNLNDEDISPTSTRIPEARDGRTDCAVSLVRYEICGLSRRLLSASSALASLCPKVDDDTVAEKERMLIDVYQRIEHKFFQHVVDETDPLYWVAAMISRVIMAKMCLVIYQPMLFPGSDFELSDEIRQRIYVAAIEINEYTLKLNTDPRCKQYRWLFKTYTNWHAIAYTLIETCRRPWTALVERGWEAVNCFDRDPVEIAKRADHAAVFLPLRKLFVRARRHRESELARLRANTEEARRLDFAERMNPAQARFGPVPGAEDRMEQVRQKWRAMVRQGGASPMSFSTCLQTPITPTPLASKEMLPSQSTSSFQQQPQQGLASNSDDIPMPMGVSDITMEYLGELISQPNINMGELWTANDINVRTAARGKIPDVSPDVLQNQLAENDALRQQALLLQTQPPRDDHVPPYLWSDPFTAMNTKFDDHSSDDLDMLGDDFNWQDWSQSIRGLEMESAQPRKGWYATNQAL